MAGVVALALALRCYRLGAQSFWIDEISVTSFVRGGRLLATLRARGGPFEPPGNYLLVAGALHLPFGFETAARVPSALFGGFEVLGLILFAAEVTRRRAVALVAGLLLALAPFAIRYGQEARYYTTFSALVLLSSWLLARAWRTGAWRDWLGWGALLGISQLVHPFTPLLVVLQLVVLGGAAAVARRRSRPRPGLRRVLAGLGVAVLVALPWYAYGALRWIPDLREGKQYTINEPGTFDVRLSFDLVRRLLEWLLGNAAGLTPLVAVLTLLAVLAPVAARGRARVVAIGSIAAVAVTVLILVPLADQQGTYFAFRRVEFLVPPMLLAAAIAIVALADRARRLRLPSTAAVSVGVAVALAVVALSSVADARYYRSQKTAYRELAERVAAAPPGTHVVIGPVPGRWRTLIPQYLRWRGVHRSVSYIRTNAPPAAVAQAVPDGSRSVLWITGVAPHVPGLTTTALNRMRVLQVVAGDESWGDALLPWFASTSTPRDAATVRAQREAVAELAPLVVRR